MSNVVLPGSFSYSFEETIRCTPRLRHICWARLMRAVELTSCGRIQLVKQNLHLFLQPFPPQ